jgi:hypothetical protein
MSRDDAIVAGRGGFRAHDDFLRGIMRLRSRAELAWNLFQPLAKPHRIAADHDGRQGIGCGSVRPARACAHRRERPET